jgi:Patched family
LTTDRVLTYFHQRDWRLQRQRYAFPTILIDFIYQVTLFIAILVLDERRIKNQREDICICTKRPVLQLDNVGVNSKDNDNHNSNNNVVINGTATDGPIVQEKNIIDRMMARYANFLMRPVIKGVVVVIFTYFLALCIYRTRPC